MKKIGKNTKLYLIGMIIGGITLGITTVIADTIINSTSVAYKTTTVKAALDELYDIADFKQEVKDMLYPVGSIYISVSSTNPSELFGGTWVSFGMGRSLIGVGWVEANNENSDGVITDREYVVWNSEQSGGEWKHTLMPAELPYDSKAFAAYTYSNAAEQGKYQWSISMESTTKWEPGTWPFHNQYDNNAAFTHDIYGQTITRGQKIPWMSPYISVYMWKRTA